VHLDALTSCAKWMDRAGPYLSAVGGVPGTSTVTSAGPASPATGSRDRTRTSGVVDLLTIRHRPLPEGLMASRAHDGHAVGDGADEDRG
jgi:hypothetical protein